MATLNIKRHRGFYIAVAAGVIAGLVVLLAAPRLSLEVGTCVFFLVYIVMVFAVAAPSLSAVYLRRHADEEDPPAMAVFIVMIGTAVISAGSLFLLMIGGHTAEGVELGLSMTSVLLGWFAVHTMMAMHYAWEFYGSPEGSARAQRHDGAVGGLEFPGADDPDGIAFLYFAYTVGMTAQTSDTAVSSNSMRKLVFVHGIFSFFYNAVILTAAVNLVLSLAH